MSRKRLSNQSATARVGFLAPEDLKLAFELMCSEIDRTPAEVYRDLMAAKLRQHAKIKRLKARAAKAERATA